MSETAPHRPRRRQVLAQQEGSVSASHTIGKKDKPHSQTQKSFATDPEQVPADPAYVSVGLGLTENLGNFESLRLDVRVTLPCGTSDAEVAAMAKHAGKLAASFLEEERQAALGDGGVAGH